MNDEWGWKRLIMVWMDGDKWIDEHPLIKLYVQQLCINYTKMIRRELANFIAKIDYAQSQEIITP